MNKQPEALEDAPSQTIHHELNFTSKIDNCTPYMGTKPRSRMYDYGSIKLVIVL